MSSVNFKSGNRYNTDPDIVLMEFWEQGKSNRHRAAHNNENVVSNGEEYIASSINVTLPNASDQIQEANISISNISRIPGKAVLSAKQQLQVRLMNSSGLDRDNFLQDTLDMLVIRDVTITPISVGGTISSKADPLIAYPFSRTGYKAMPGIWI